MKVVLVIIGERKQEKDVLAKFKESLREDEQVHKIRIRPDRLTQDAQAQDPRERLAPSHPIADPQEWLVSTREEHRLEGEEQFTSLETYIRRRMKGVGGQVFFVNLDSHPVDNRSVSQEFLDLGWKRFDYTPTPVSA